MLLTLLFPALLLTSSAHAALSLLYPHSTTTWFKNNTVTLNWTRTDPSTDTYLFRTLLSNQDQGLYQGNNSIADSTNATAEFVRILLPNVPASDGYVINLVNTTNEAQVYATSDPFSIEEGTVSSSSSSASASGTGSPTSSGGNIPNAGTPISFPSASQSGAAVHHASLSLGGAAMMAVVPASIFLGVALLA